MRAFLLSMAVVGVAALGGCDPTGYMAKAGCAVGSCLPDAESGYQCLATDIAGDMWLARGGERSAAIDGVRRECAAESEAPESCMVIANDCLPLVSYCPGGENDTSQLCQLYGSYENGTSGPLLEF